MKVHITAKRAGENMPKSEGSFEGLKRMNAHMTLKMSNNRDGSDFIIDNSVE
tara:strand:+ start:623 stop:778 length:156 start_codon:yes stop_codon:yes gene_type:complete